MIVTIELPSEIEAALLTQARTEGLAVSDYVERLVVEKLADKLEAKEAERPAYELPPEEWIRKFNAWTESHKSLNLPFLSDGDISRESIYGERGL